MSRYLNTLIALVDAAEQRPLTAREAEVLRAQLRSLDSNRRQVAGLLAALEDSRRELELMAGVVAPLVGCSEQEIAAGVRGARRQRPRAATRSDAA